MYIVQLEHELNMGLTIATVYGDNRIGIIPIATVYGDNRMGIIDSVVYLLDN